jgi:glycosyltransferase involved in cell wall biosynthesis
VTMRIAALIAAESVSGPARQLTALAAGLAARDMEFLVLLTARSRSRPPLADWLERAGVTHDIVPDRGPLDWRMIDRTRSAIESFGASLLQTHGYKATAIGAALRHRGMTRPWVGFYHGATRKGLKDVAWQSVERHLLRSADRIVIVAPAQAALFAGREGVLRLIDNAVVPEPGGGATLRLPATTRPVIGVIGRLSEEKGVDVFLHACHRLQSQGHAFTACVAGDGPQRDVLHALAGRLGLRDRVMFLGQLDSAAGLYPQLDLLVIPSRSEGMPNVLLEALGADVPVVSTRVGAVPDVLQDAAAGVLVQPDDPEGLAAGILEALQRGRTPAAAAARARAADRYSLDARMERHVELYRELLGQLSAPTA